MRSLPDTDMHHGWRVALFALSCLYADLTTHHRKKAQP